MNTGVAVGPGRLMEVNGREPAPIDEALNRLQSARFQLEEQLNVLINRISPILQDDTSEDKKSTGSDDERPYDANSVILKSINDEHMGIALLIGRVAGVISRVQV